MAETYSAGIVTAYGAAVRGGYTGTYERFCAEQAQFGANAAKVAQDRAAVEAATETFTTETVPGAVQTVQQTGATQVQAVEAASDTEQQQIALTGAAQETRVTQAGDDQVDAVEEAGATQVGNVNTAGATQVQAVEDKGQEVIGSIPADYTELTEDVADLKSAIIEETPVTLTLEQQKRYDVQNGTLNVLTGSSYNTIKSAIINVNPGETYLYSGRVYNYANQYSLIAVDSDNTPLKYELNNTSDTTVTDYSFTIPDGASQLIIQSYMTTPTLKLYENAISDLTTKTEVLRHDVDEITIDARAQEYNNVMRSISRLGLSSVAPHNSRAAFLAAYRFGFRILLCDLRFTQDGDPVLFHDRYINQNYRNVYYTGGGMVPRDSQITIESLTTAQVQGLEYRKTIDGVLTAFPIMFLDEMCLLVKQIGTELYLECKTALSAAQAETACNIVLKYGIVGKTSWTANGASYLTEVVSKIPYARVATMPSIINASQITELKGLLTGQNEIFMFSWNTVSLTDSIINLLTADNIPLEIGSIDGSDNILAYISQGIPYRYVSGIESNTTIAGKAILENVLS